MESFIHKKHESHSSSIAPNSSKKKPSTSPPGLVDNRSEAAVQRKQLEAMGKSVVGNPMVQRKPNNTGLPDNLKTGLENLSGYGMDDVKVHYNSDKPAQIQAHAYAQGTDIHLATGQEKHLSHEAWHVVQQKQGRVGPTMQMKGKVRINDDSGLEREADEMGAKAQQMDSELAKKSFTNDKYNEKGLEQGVLPISGQNPIQRLIYIREDGHIKYPLPPNVTSALGAMGLKKKDQGSRMEKIMDALIDDKIRVISKSDMIQYLKGTRIPPPNYEEDMDYAEFPFEVSNYLRDTAGILLTGDSQLDTILADKTKFSTNEGWLRNYLRDFNINRTKMRKEDLNTTNRVSAGITIVYQVKGGKIQQWQARIPGAWQSQDSGPRVKTSSSSGKAQDSFGEMTVDHRETYQEFLASQTHLDEFGRRSSLSMAVNNVKGKPENISNYGPPLYHSENAFAHDIKERPDLIGHLIATFLKLFPGGVILQAVLDVDSFPNTMCTNMCRGSIDYVRRILDQLIKKLAQNRLHQGFRTHSRTYASKFFPKPNTKSKSFEQHSKRSGGILSKPVVIQDVGGHGPRSGFNFEVMWDKKKSMGKKGKGQQQDDEVDWSQPVACTVNGNFHRITTDVPGDGNCFYNAVNRAISGNKGVAYYRSIVGQTFAEARGDGVWAEDEHIRELARRLNARIVVHVFGFGNQELTIQPYGNGDHTIHLANVNYNHFQNVHHGQHDSVDIPDENFPDVPYDFDDELQEDDSSSSSSPKSSRKGRGNKKSGSESPKKKREKGLKRTRGLLKNDLEESDEEDSSGELPLVGSSSSSSSKSLPRKKKGKVKKKPKAPTVKKRGRYKKLEDSK